MKLENQGPWNLPEFTKLRHKRWGWTVTYEYDVCYQNWYLWTGTTLLVLEDWQKEEFDIL